MWERIPAFAAALVLTVGLAGAVLAAEGPGKRDSAGMPKGTFATSCSCQISGGVLLMCFCNNLEAKLFQTTLDIRSCPGPKDIKNCNGTLTCTASSSTQCPGK